MSYIKSDKGPRSHKLDYDGVQYDTILFAENISRKQKVVRLADSLGHQVDLYLPDAGVDDCAVYREGNFTTPLIVVRLNARLGMIPR